MRCPTWRPCAHAAPAVRAARRDVAVKDYYWETEPDQEHISYNFDIRKVRPPSNVAHAV